MYRLPILLLALTACESESPLDTVDTDTIEVAGSCVYVNSFSQTEECKEYLGSGWSVDSMESDCAAPLPGASGGALSEGAACDRTSFLAECFIDADSDAASILVFPGEAGDSCGGLAVGCSFAGGEYVPTELCDEAVGPEPTASVFQPFEQVCVDPMPGEEAGDGPNGQVCTWEAISAATEEGRNFADYADCDTVRTQRPYFPASVENNTDVNDPRLSNSDWAAEYEWVSKQLDATACVCCHSESEAPDGASGWYLEAEPIWTDTLDDDGMAMMAGWVNSDAFGAFDAQDNNGFDRALTGVPTTDPERMLAFFEGELAGRGFTQADFSDTPPFGGPLYDQLVYEASDCRDGIGVDAQGMVQWDGGGARYLYIMAADANPPGVPPNLDLPDGTLWRVDVAPTADPITSGVGYGSVPAGATQRFPATGTPAALQSGETYYLYALADVYQPVTRCLFVAP